MFISKCCKSEIEVLHGLAASYYACERCGRYCELQEGAKFEKKDLFEDILSKSLPNDNIKFIDA